MRAQGHIDRLRGLAGDRRVRLLAGIAAFAAVTLFTVLVAHPRMFTGFASYDDEGYMLIALKSYVNHGSLYDDVFSQYGPFYYEAWGGVFSALGISVTHDAGRTATLVAWVLTSLTFGLSTLRMTGSILLGVVVQMLVFAGIGTLTNEPMHPGGIICLLLAAIVAASCLVKARTSPGAMGLLGAVVAALVLVKINVGVFALAAVVLACVVSFPALSRHRWLRLAVEVAFVATPILLMTAKLGEPWARHYAAHVSIAALAVVIALRAREDGPRETEELWWLGGGFAAAALAILAAAIGSGTSLGGLFDGVIGQPLRQTDAFSLPFGQSSRAYLIDGLALGAALAYWYVGRARVESRAPGWVGAISLSSILIGVEMALSVIGKTLPFEATGLAGYQLSLLAFAWVALIPDPGASKASAFARLLLPPLAILQALHAYPVAGSQTLWSAFLLIPVGALCVANGVRGLGRVVQDGQERRAVAVFGAVAALVLGLYIADATLRQPLRDSRAARDAAIPLDLPGSSRIRLNQPEAELYELVSREVAANCDSFVMLPGMDSFYLWTDQEPPTGFNATGWTTLFDEEDQRRVIADTRSIEGLCLLENDPLAAGWSQGEIPDEPLVRYLHKGFEPVLSVGDYKLLKREGTAEDAS